MIKSMVLPVTQAAAPTFNTNNIDVISITALAQAITSMTTNQTGSPQVGDALTVEITDNGTARAIAWGALFEDANNVLLPLTTVLSVKLTVDLRWNATTSKWRVHRVTGNALALTNPTITNYTESVVAIGNTSTAKTIDLTNGTVQTATLTGNCTFTMPTAVAGKSFLLALNTGAGSFTATFTGVKWPAATAPTVTTAASKVDLFSFSCFDGTNWYGTVIQAFA